MGREVVLGDGTRPWSCTRGHCNGMVRDGAGEMALEGKWWWRGVDECDLLNGVGPDLGEQRELRHVGGSHAEVLGHGGPHRGNAVCELGASWMVRTQQGSGGWGQNGWERRARILCVSAVARQRWFEIEKEVVHLTSCAQRP